MSSAADDHFDGRLFFNPGVNVDKSLNDILRWQRSRQRSRWPKSIENAPFPQPPADIAAGDIAVTFIGQATFLLQFQGLNMLTDPIFSDRASPFSWIGPKRVRPPAVSVENLPRIDVVLLSHNHYDHMDLASLRNLAARWRPTIVTGLQNGRYLAGKGIGPSIELDWWESWRPNPEMRVTYVPAQHWSSRRLFDRRRMLWGGHVIEAPAGCVYFAGDTGYSGHFRTIRERMGCPDIGLLPIGAYEPRWFMETQHMNPDEAVLAHVDLQAKTSIAMHFGTFQLTDEPIDAPVLALEAARSKHHVSNETFIIPEFGRAVMWSRQDRLRPSP